MTVGDTHLPRLGGTRTAHQARGGANAALIGSYENEAAEVWTYGAEVREAL
jgi:hypothetical protein